MTSRRCLPALVAFLTTLFCALLAFPGQASDAVNYRMAWPVKHQKLMQGYRFSTEYPSNRSKASSEKRNPHYAIDIAGADGRTEVRAAADGEIYCVYLEDGNGPVSRLKSCPNPKCRLPGMKGQLTSDGPSRTYPPGNHVILYHENGGNSYYTLYHHLAKKAVNGIRLPKQGENPIKVKQGDLLGYVGNTGFSGGPHLHFAAMKGKGAPGVWKDPGRMLNPLDYLDNFHSVKATDIKETSANISFTLFAYYDTPRYGVQFGLSPEDLTWVDNKPDEMGWHVEFSQDQKTSYIFGSDIKNGSFKLSGEYTASGGRKLKIEPGTTYYYRLYYTSPFYQNYKGFADISKYDRYFSKVYQFTTSGRAKSAPVIKESYIEPGEIKYELINLTGAVRLGVISWPTSRQDEIKGAYLTRGMQSVYEPLDAGIPPAVYASDLVGPMKTGESYSIQLFVLKDGVYTYSPVRRFTAGSAQSRGTQAKDSPPIPLTTPLPLMPREAFDASSSQINLDLISARVKDVGLDRLDAYSADISLVYEGRDTPCLFELLAKTEKGEEVITLSQVKDSAELKNGQNRVQFYIKGLKPETRYEFSIRAHYFYSMGDVVAIRNASPENRDKIIKLAEQRKLLSSKPFTGNWHFTTKADLNKVEATDVSAKASAINSLNIYFKTAHPLLPDSVSLTLKAAPGLSNPGFPVTFTSKYERLLLQGNAKDVQAKATNEFALHFSHMLFEYHGSYDFELVLNFKNREPLRITGTVRSPDRKSFDVFRKRMFPRGDKRMGDGFTYIINEGYAMLTGIYDTAHFKNQNKKSKFKLPEKADGYPVIAVAHDFPWHQIGRNVVVVPEGYRALGRSALQGTDEIPIFTLEFPATLSIIEPGFFKQIYKLKLNSDN